MTESNSPGQGAPRERASPSGDGLTASLAFERPIYELRRIPDVSLNGELIPLERKRDRLLAEIFSNLTPWQTVEVARHPRRPQFSDYVEGILDDYVELHGDRLFGEDKAIATGFAR